MELELKKNRYECYRKQILPTMNSEVMREHIVPDSFSDIACIIETNGHVSVKSREIGNDGCISASGHVDVSVLYIPEKGKGPCVLRYQIPFQCCSDVPCDSDAQHPDVIGEIQNIDTRMLNPRKVLTRVNMALYPSVCCHMSRTVCVGAEESDELELLHCKRKTREIAAIKEKEFSCVDEIAASLLRGGAEEIVYCHTEVMGIDCKLIGTKLVVKGSITASVLYRNHEGELDIARAELPFSQILDGSGLREEWEYDTDYRVLSTDCRIGSETAVDDHSTLTISVQLLARVSAHRGDEIEFVADLYSTACSVICRTEEVTLLEDHYRHMKRLNVRETLETGMAVKSILDTECECLPVRVDTVSRMLEIPVHVKCLYLDEGDVIHGVRREFIVKNPLEQEGDIEVECIARCIGDITAGILPDGIELRFPVECSVDTVKPKVYLSVSGAEIVEEQSDSPTPSLVLRKIQPDETLWSVAKANRTTCRAIISINELSDDVHIPTDRMLLIPRRR